MDCADCTGLAEVWLADRASLWLAPAVLISPAKPADLPALVTLERSVFAHATYPDFFFRQAMELWPHWLLLVRDDAGAPLGYILGAPADTPGHAWVLSAATLPAARGRGLGAGLLTRLLGLMACADIREVRLTVHPDNPARRLYERAGFTEAVRDDAYFGPAEPRLVLRRELGPADLHLINTPRLTLRHFRFSDAPFVLQLLNTEGWLRFIGDRGVRNDDDARAYLRRAALAIYARHGFGPWHVARRDTGEAVGLCGLLQRPYLDMPDVGFAFLPAHEGRGYATEAAAATMAFARTTLGLTRFGAIVLPTNAASLRVLQKLGFTDAGRITPPGTQEELALLRCHFTGESRA